MGVCILPISSAFLMCSPQDSDTSSDAAIAAALQEELKREENKNQACKHEAGAVPDRKPVRQYVLLHEQQPCDFPHMYA